MKDTSVKGNLIVHRGYIPLSSLVTVRNATNLNSDSCHQCSVHFESWVGKILFQAILYSENEALETSRAEYVSPEVAAMVTDSAKPGNRALHYRLILTMLFFNNFDFFFTIFMKRRQTPSLWWALKHLKMVAIAWSGLTTCLAQGVRTEAVCTDGQTRWVFVVSQVIIFIAVWVTCSRGVLAGLCDVLLPSAPLFSFCVSFLK